MFGPDKCGEDYKLHFIFRHKNPKTGEYEEKHAKRPDVDLKKFYLDKKTHLYTLGIYLGIHLGKLTSLNWKGEIKTVFQCPEALYLSLILFVCNSLLILRGGCLVVWA